MTGHLQWLFLRHVELTRKYLLNGFELFLFGIAGVNLPVQPAELITHYAPLHICSSKGHYCRSEFHRGARENSARCFSNDFLQITVAPRCLSSSHLFALCAFDVFFSPCHSPNLSSWLFSTSPHSFFKYLVAFL